MPFDVGQRVRITRLTDGRSKSGFLGVSGTIRVVEVTGVGPSVKEADCLYLIRFDRRIQGHWVAGFWGDEIEPVGAPRFVAAVGAVQE